MAQDCLDRWRLCPVALLTGEAITLHRIASEERHLPYPGALQDQPAWYNEARGIVREVTAMHDWRQAQPTTTPEARPRGGY